MVSVNDADLSAALDFVSCGAPMEHSAEAEETDAASRNWCRENDIRTIEDRGGPLT